MNMQSMRGGTVGAPRFRSFSKPVVFQQNEPVIVYDPDTELLLQIVACVAPRLNRFATIDQTRRAYAMCALQAIGRMGVNPNLIVQKTAACERALFQAGRRLTPTERARCALSAARSTVVIRTI